MLKETIQFEDFDGVNRTKNVYFNLDIVEVIDLQDLQNEFMGIQRDIFQDAAPDRVLEPEETRRVVNLVKQLMELAYGVQVLEDGDLTFDKTPSRWKHFTQTAAYSALLLALFQQPDRAVRFMTEIFPKELRAVLDGGVDENQLTLPGTDASPAADNRPVWLQENREPTQKEIMAMPPEEMLLATKMKMAGEFNTAPPPVAPTE